MVLFQGEPYADFVDHRRPLSFPSASSLVRTQTEIIAESLGALRLPSTRARRQAIVYMLEQCSMLARAFDDGVRPAEGRRMKRVARAVKRALGIVRR